MEVEAKWIHLPSEQISYFTWEIEKSSNLHVHDFILVIFDLVIKFLNALHYIIPFCFVFKFNVAALSGCT